MTNSGESGNEEPDATACCPCFGSLFYRDSQKNNGNCDMQMRTLNKPRGLFGHKSYKEACMEVAEKTNFGGLSDINQYGLISCIVKHGDDLKQE